MIVPLFIHTESSGYGSKTVRLGKDSLQVLCTIIVSSSFNFLSRNLIAAVFLFNHVEIQS